MNNDTKKGYSPKSDEISIGFLYDICTTCNEIYESYLNTDISKINKKNRRYIKNNIKSLFDEAIQMLSDICINFEQSRNLEDIYKIFNWPIHNLISKKDEFECFIYRDTILAKSTIFEMVSYCCEKLNCVILNGMIKNVILHSKLILEYENKECPFFLVCAIVKAHDFISEIDYIIGQACPLFSLSESNDPSLDFQQEFLNMTFSKFSLYINMVVNSLICAISEDEWFKIH